MPTNSHRHRAPTAVIRVEVAPDERGGTRLEAGRRRGALSARLWRHLFQLAAMQRLRRRVTARGES